MGGRWHPAAKARRLSRLGCASWPTPYRRPYPRLEGASSELVADTKDLRRVPSMPMETMLGELVLVALLLAVVVVSGRV